MARWFEPNVSHRNTFFKTAMRLLTQLESRPRCLIQVYSAGRRPGNHQVGKIASPWILNARLVVGVVPSLGVEAVAVPSYSHDGTPPHHLICSFLSVRAGFCLHNSPCGPPTEPLEFLFIPQHQITLKSSLLLFSVSVPLPISFKGKTYDIESDTTVCFACISLASLWPRFIVGTL